MLVSGIVLGRAGVRRTCSRKKADERRAPGTGQHIWVPPEGRVPAAERRGASMRHDPSGREPGNPARNGVGPSWAGAERPERETVSTRTLLILAAITGVAILTAGAVQILLAR
jgi:hypothetical protein